VSNYREPGRATAVGSRSIGSDENTPDDILVELNAEGVRDLLSDLATAEERVAPFHLDHRVDQLSGWTLGSGATAPPRAVEQTIFALDQNSMKAQEGRGLQHHGYLAQASGRHQQCTKSKDQPIPPGQIRTPAVRTLHDEQLVLDRQRLGRDRTNAAGTGQPRQGHQQVSNQLEPQRHAAPEFNALPSIRKPALRDRPVPELAIRHTQALFVSSIANLKAGSLPAFDDDLAVNEQSQFPSEDDGRSPVRRDCGR